MCRKLASIFALSILPVFASAEVYPKDMKPLQAPDAAAQACFNHMNTNATFPDPSSTELLSSSKKWVAVKGVGARQMVTIRVLSKTGARMPVRVQLFNCVLMGDNATIDTRAYKLL